MKVTVLGKEYASGTSKKTGKDFAATVVHVSHKKNGVDGLSVDNMTTFFATMLSLVADFLAADPIIYLFGLVCLILICKAVKIIVS